MVLGGAVVVMAAAAWPPGARRVPAAVLGAAAGVVFGVEGATLKVASDDIAGGVSLATVLGVATWATLGGAVIGVVIQNLARVAGSLALGAGQHDDRHAGGLGRHRFARVR